MSLQDWERNGWLQRHKTSPNEIRDLLAVVERDLADSATEGLSSDWRMNIAYNAALQAATAALAAAAIERLENSTTVASSNRCGKPWARTRRQ